MDRDTKELRFAEATGGATTPSKSDRTLENSIGGGSALKPAAAYP